MQLAPHIAKHVPQGFSDYNQSRIQHLRDMSGHLSRTSTLGQMPNVMDDGTGLNLANPVTSSFTPENLSVTVPSSWQGPTDTVDAANASGGLSTPSGTWISDLIKGASQLYLTKSQLDTANKL